MQISHCLRIHEKNIPDGIQCGDRDGDQYVSKLHNTEALLKKLNISNSIYI